MKYLTGLLQSLAVPNRIDRERRFITPPQIKDCIERSSGVDQFLGNRARDARDLVAMRRPNFSIGRVRVKHGRGFGGGEHAHRGSDLARRQQAQAVVGTPQSAPQRIVFAARDCIIRAQPGVLVVFRRALKLVRVERGRGKEGDHAFPNPGLRLVEAGVCEVAAQATDGFDVVAGFFLHFAQRSRDEVFARLRVPFWQAPALVFGVAQQQEVRRVGCARPQHDSSGHDWVGRSAKFGTCAFFRGGRDGRQCTDTLTGRGRFGLRAEWLRGA